MAVHEHGLEVIRKSGAEITPGNNTDYYLQVGNFPGNSLDVEGNIRPSGLTIGGRVTVTTLTTTPSALPVTPLTDRNTMSIQNQDTSNDVIINYVSSFSEGVIIYAGGNKEFAISDSIVVYGRAVSGTAKISIEELA